MHTRPTVFFLPRAWSWRLVCTALGAAGGIAHPAQATQIPSTPPCVAAPAFRTRLPAAPGELLRYAVSVDGLAVGTIDFAIERVGIFAGEPAVVFRSAFQLDGMWAALAEITGTATAVVARSSGLPLHATTDVTQRQRRVREVVRFSQGAQQLAVRRRVGPDAASAEVKLPANAQPTHDFLTALYNLRRIEAAADALSFAVPLPPTLTSVKAADVYWMANREQSAKLRPLLVGILLSAGAHADHPFRAIARSAPHFLQKFDEVLGWCGEAAHMGPTPADLTGLVEPAVDYVYQITNLLLAAASPAVTPAEPTFRVAPEPQDVDFDDLDL